MTSRTRNRKRSDMSRKVTLLEAKLSRCKEALRKADEDNAALFIQIRKQRRMAKVLEQLQPHLDDTRAVSRAIVQAATAFLDCESGSIMLPDADGRTLRIVANEGLQPCEEGITFVPNEGFAGRAWATGEPVWTGNDAENHQYFAIKPVQKTRFRSLAAVPIVSSTDIIGVLSCHNKRDDDVLDEDDIANLVLLSSYVASTLQLAPLREEQKRLATYDAMTGLIRRDRLADILTAEFPKHPRSFVHFFLLDMVKFKRINDTYGHQKGDAVIRAIANKLKELYARRSDVFLCHWGGDEFALVVFSHEKAVAAEVRRTVLSGINSLRCQELPNEEFSASVGHHTMPTEKADYDKLVAVADRKMYQQKERDRKRLEDCL